MKLWRIALLSFCLLALNERDVKAKDAAPESAGGPVVFIRLDSSINPGTGDYIEHAITKAKEKNAEALVIELDTPGGLLDSTRRIVKAILNSDLPVAVYVGPRGARAGSAGVFITLAGHVAAMAPGTNIGAAHPVTGMGGDPEKEGGKHMAEKIENDTAAFIETIANQRKRNVHWAKEAVLKSISVTEETALKEQVIDFIAKDRQDLMAKMDGRAIELPGRTVTLHTLHAPMENLEMSWKQIFIDKFSNPNIIYFLMLLAALGIYLELSHPGAILPGFAAAISIILILLTSQSLPFNVGGVLLLVVGVVFFILEVYVTSYGMLALGGIACFVVGSILLFDPDASLGVFTVSKPVIFISAAILGGIVGLTAYLIARSQMTKAMTGYEGMIGDQGEAVSDLNLEGKVLLNGEYWNAKAETPVAKGAKVRVVKAEGLVLTVTLIS